MKRSDGLPVVVRQRVDYFLQRGRGVGKCRGDEVARFTGRQQHRLAGFGFAERRQFVVDFLDVGQLRLQAVEQVEPVGADGQQHVDFG
ncbi:MAG: hypothetical protein KA165_04955, partial [Saprospiraceae bacterium]|nr:hypothetical protein [Saprospiraceae bacterium]